MKGYGAGGGGGSPWPKGPGPQAAATGAAPFHLYSGGGSLSFCSFFHFGGSHFFIFFTWRGHPFDSEGAIIFFIFFTWRGRPFDSEGLSEIFFGGSPEREPQREAIDMTSPCFFSTKLIVNCMLHMISSIHLH